MLLLQLFVWLLFFSIPSFRVLKDGTLRQNNFYCVDAAKFVVNKLVDRGSLSEQGFLTNLQDFISHVVRDVGLWNI